MIWLTPNSATKSRWWSALGQRLSAAISNVDAARALIRAHPERMRQEQATADTMIAAAAQLGRWDELERAVAIKVAQQHEFVAIWGAKVRSQDDVRKKSPAEGFLSVTALQRQTGISKQQASRWRRRTAPEHIDEYRQHIIDVATQAAELKARANHLAQGTGADGMVHAARLCRGGAVCSRCDRCFDPASAPRAQEWIKAKTFFTEQDDGLTKEWRGRIWPNPPYTKARRAPNSG